MNRAQLTAAKDVDRYSRIAYLLRTTCPYCHGNPAALVQTSGAAGR